MLKSKTLEEARQAARAALKAGEPGKAADLLRGWVLSSPGDGQLAAEWASLSAQAKRPRELVEGSLWASEAFLRSGEPQKALAVVDALLRVQPASMDGMVERLEVVGPYEIAFHLKAPDVTFAGRVSNGQFGVVSKKYFEAVGDTEAMSPPATSTSRVADTMPVGIRR